MKKYIVVIGAILVLLLAACSGGAAQTETDPITIVREFYAAIAGQEVDKAMTYVAEDAQFINPTGTYNGKDEVRGNIQALSDGKFVFELRDLKNDNGLVTYGYTLYIDGEAVEEGDNGATVVRDGKIVFDGLAEDVPVALR
jgi:hypothetical protein